MYSLAWFTLFFGLKTRRGTIAPVLWSRGTVQHSLGVYQTAFSIDILLMFVQILNQAERPSGRFDF